MTSFEVEYQRPGHVGASLGPLYVTVHDGLPDLVDFDEMLGMAERMLQRHDRLSAITVFIGHLPIMVDPARRAAAERVTKALPNKSVCSAIVLSAEGIRGSIYRTLISGLQVVARSNTLTNIFVEFDECVPWLAEKDERFRGRTQEVCAAYHALLRDHGFES